MKTNIKPPLTWVRNDIMKFRSIATMAVLAMFLASSVLVVGNTSDSNGSADDETVTAGGLTITKDTEDFTDEWDGHAIYTKADTTLRLIGDFTLVCNSTTIIDSTVEMITIVVEGNVKLMSSKVEQKNDGLVIKEYYDDEGKGYNCGTVMIKGEKGSSLTMIPAPTINNSHQSFGVQSGCIYIKDCDITVDFQSESTYYNCVGMECWEMNIVNSNVIFNGAYSTDMYYSTGIRNNYSTRIENSTVEMKGFAMGVAGHGGYTLPGMMAGVCMIIKSNVCIECADDVSGSSIGLNLESLIAMDSTITSMGGTCYGHTAKDAQGVEYKLYGASVGINSETIVAEGCNITSSGKRMVSNDEDHSMFAFVSSGIEFYYNAIFTDCVLKCTAESGTWAELQAAIKSDFGVMVAENCKITARSIDNNKTLGEKYRVVAIGCHSDLRNCEVDAEGTMGAFDSDRMFSFSTNERIQGLDKDTGKWVDITSDQVSDYLKVRVTTQTSDNLNVGIIIAVIVSLMAMGAFAIVICARKH